MDDNTVETPETPEVEIDPSDTDALAYQAAMDEIAAEDKPEEGTENGEAEVTAVTETPVDPAPADKEVETDKPAVNEEENVDENQPTIPKARFDQVLKERDEAKTKATFAEGKLEALKNQQPQVPQEPARRVPTSQEAIDFYRGKIDEAAKKFDDGEVSYQETKRLEFAANDKIREIERTEQERQRQSEPQTPQVNVAEEMRNERFIQTLEEKHPYSANGVIQGGERWALIQSEAKQALVNEGVSNPTQNQFVEAVAKMTDKYGPLWVGELPGSKPTVQTSNTPKPTAKQVGAKLDLAGQHPANVGELGSSGVSEGLTESKIMAMSEEEMDALPDSVLDKFRS